LQKEGVYLSRELLRKCGKQSKEVPRGGSFDHYSHGGKGLWKGRYLIRVIRSSVCLEEIRREKELHYRKTNLGTVGTVKKVGSARKKKAERLFLTRRRFLFRKTIASTRKKEGEKVEKPIGEGKNCLEGSFSC